MGSYLEWLIPFLLILLIIVIICIGIICCKLFAKTQTPEINIQNILKQYFLESESRVIDRLDLKINNLTHQSQDSLTKEIKDTKQHLINNLENSLKVLREQNVTGFQEVQNIHKLLCQNDKIGQAGEFLLTRILENIIQMKDKLIFEKQFLMKKTNIHGQRLRVDVMCKGHGKFVQIPIDSKFPTTDFLAYMNNAENQTVLKKRFFDHVKARIKETEKYVSKEDHAPYAIMFVPSESIFSQINLDEEIISYAFKRNVIITSPSILLAILNSVDYYFQIFESVQDNEEKFDCIDNVLQAMKNFDKVFINDFKTALEKVLKVLDDIQIKEKTLEKRYQKLLELRKKEND
ncbi:DNA recombination protein RmuC ['Fragaria x ananassa' phyllody phytoplasma]|uniref:DNA recombination protein RmuC n=1 Tax='Fragaria x ananassa' phyllody phytoplasma TaxID=2358428 RepID=A0ABS5K3R7_9MOLU|nr:DNA recombination protein RmuC ['Fragaria x ananassa' phyllody phytoplasma]MBS2126369.1 DNA recombination protein RmuC ['Fragaria x ananassa' phyllody phytoplasma]